MSNFKCYFCGGDLCWNSNADLEEEDEMDEGIVSFYSCLRCGRFYEIYDYFNKETNNGG